MKQSFIFSGSGGQGIMSAGIMLAQTAISAGMHATYMPEYGPQQRGGSAKCTVVIDDESIISPLPFKCNNLIVLNEQALNAHSQSLSSGGLLIANANRINKEDIQKLQDAGKLSSDIRIISVNVDDIAVSIGSIKLANVILLAILAGAGGKITKEALEQSLTQKFKSKGDEILQMNFKALEAGYKIGRGE